MLARKSTLTAFGLLVLATLLIASSPGMTKEEVRIAPFMAEVTIGPSQEGYYSIRWWNCSYGISLDWIEATEQRYALYKDGQLVQEFDAGDAKWEDPYSIGTSPECLYGDGTGWGTSWRYDKLDIKEPGDYVLVTYLAINTHLTDGLDFDHDGYVDWYEGPIFDNTETLIHVLE